MTPTPKNPDAERLAREIWLAEMDSLGGRELTVADLCDASIRCIVRALEQPAQEGWLPIESAPTDGTRVLLANEHGCWMAEYRPVFQSGYRPENPWQSVMLNHDHIAWPGRYERQTHWKPLDAPPAAPTKERT